MKQKILVSQEIKGVGCFSAAGKDKKVKKGRMC